MSGASSTGRKNGRARRRFEELMRRGREFEKKEKDEWKNLTSGAVRYEIYKKKARGRLDIRIDEADDFVSVIEIKATDWDRILPHRLRVTALRHGRQIWRYIDAELAEKKQVCPAIVYPSAPYHTARRQAVEDALNERGIQVVWHDER
jgi:hypothetical protein